MSDNDTDLDDDTKKLDPQIAALLRLIKYNKLENADLKRFDTGEFSNKLAHCPDQLRDQIIYGLAIRYSELPEGHKDEHMLAGIVSRAAFSMLHKQMKNQTPGSESQELTGNLYEMTTRVLNSLRRKGIDTQKSVVGYIYNATKNLLIDQWSVKTVPTVSVQDLGYTNDKGELVAFDIPEPVKPREGEVKEDRWAAILEAVTKLDPVIRDTFLARYYYQYDKKTGTISEEAPRAVHSSEKLAKLLPDTMPLRKYEDIAAEMGTTIGTVRSRLHRALVYLNKHSKANYLDLYDKESRTFSEDPIEPKPTDKKVVGPMTYSVIPHSEDFEYSAPRVRR